MAYKDFNGKITIDEVAARQDIEKINIAIMKLEEAKNALNQVIQQGTHTKGSTGSAIVSKGSELKKQLDIMTNNLNNEVRAIRQTVEKYKRLDAEVKAEIMKH